MRRDIKSVIVMDQYLICFKDDYFIFELTSNMYEETMSWLGSIRGKNIGKLAVDVFAPDSSIQKFNILNTNDLQAVASTLMDYL